VLFYVIPLLGAGVAAALLMGFEPQKLFGRHQPAELAA
jgi:hypothetical protein